MALKKTSIPSKAPDGLETSWKFLYRLFTNFQRRLPRYRFHSAVLVTKTSNQSIPDNSFTAISWDAATYDDASLWASGSPTKFVVPGSFDGRAVISAGGAFATDSTGVRQLRLRQNGADFDGMFNLIVTPTSGTTSLYATSALVDADESDEYIVETRQTSGGALNFLASDASWFSMILYEASAK